MMKKLLAIIGILGLTASAALGQTVSTRQPAGWKWNHNGGVVYLRNVTDSVGIGTSSPSSRLEVVGGITATSFTGDGTNLTNVTAAAAESVHWDNVTNKPVSLDTDSTDDLTTSTNFGGNVSGTYDNIALSETDPIYGSDPASGISSGDITNWDNAYGWGDHGAAGYAVGTDLTNHTGNISLHVNATEQSNWDGAYAHSQSSHPFTDDDLSDNTTDQLAQGSTNKYANTTKEDHGETAYNWGDHSTEGYLTGEADPEAANQTGWTAQDSGTVVLTNSSANVGIGTTAPTRKLEIDGGEIRLSDNNFGLTNSGTLRFRADDNDNNAANNIMYTFYTGSLENATNFAMGILKNGNVGIGTTAPSSPLHLNSDTSRQLRITAPAGGQSGIDIESGALSTRIIVTEGADTFRIYDQNDGKNRLHIKPTSGDVIMAENEGNVGIGTNAPGAKLDVDASNSDFRVLGGGSTNYLLQYPVNTAQEGGLLVRQAGNNKPAVYFDNDNGVSTGALVEFEHANEAADDIITGGTNESLRVNPNGSGAILLQPTGDGNVGIGTTAPDAKLQVAGTINATAMNVGGSAVLTSESDPGVTTHESTYDHGSYDSHLANTTIHVTASNKTTWDAKIDGSSLNASNLDAGTIPLARYGTDSITEEKLNIANSPSNGKRLTWNGTAASMEWMTGGSGDSLWENVTGGIAPVYSGNVSIGTTAPVARLHIVPESTDPAETVYVAYPGAPVIFTSPDGSCSACSVNNADVFSCSGVVCPGVTVETSIYFNGAPVQFNGVDLNFIGG